MKTKHGAHRPRQPGPIRNPIQSAILRATLFTADEIKELMAPTRQCAKLLAQGVATEDQHGIVQTAFHIAQGIEDGGIVRLLQPPITEALAALKAIDRRANATGAWRPTALHYHELNAINVMLNLHEFQLRKFSSGELHRVVQKIINKTISTGGSAYRLAAGDVYSTKETI